MPNPLDTNAAELYQLPLDQQAARTAAKIAALRDQETFGLIMAASPVKEVAEGGRLSAESAGRQMTEGQRTSGFVLNQTLDQQQREVANEHNRREYERQVAADAEHAKLIAAQVRHLNAESAKAREPEPTYTLVPGVGPNGESMWVNKKQPLAAPLPMAEQTAIAPDPAKQRAMALKKLPAAEGKIYESNDSTLQSLKRLRDKMVEHPNAFGITADLASYLPEKAPNFLKNALSSTQARQRVGTGDQEVFTLAQNIGQKIVKERAGLRGETSPMVQAKIGAFLPKPTDPLPVALSKVDSYINELAAEQEDKHRLYNIPALPKVAPSPRAPAVQQRALQYLQTQTP